MFWGRGKRIGPTDLVNDVSFVINTALQYCEYLEDQVNMLTVRIQSLENEPSSVADLVYDGLRKEDP